MSRPKPNPLQKAARKFLRDLIAPAPKPKKRKSVGRFNSKKSQKESANG